MLPVPLRNVSRALELSLDQTASKATTGTDLRWQFTTNIQLLVNPGSNLKPAISYREGKGRSLSHDKQVILGVAAEFL